MAVALSMLWTQLQLASDIITTMDQKADPCVDFYKFSCGNYEKHVKLPDDRSSMMPLVEMGQRINKELRDLLEKDDPSIDWSTPSATLVKTYYQSCINESAMESVGTAPLKEALHKYGGWPILLGDDWKADNFNWIRTNAILTRKLGLSNILEFTFGVDFKNSTKRVFEIDQPRLALDKRDYYVNKNYSKFLDKYLQYMIRSAVQLGASESAAKKEMEEALAFETSLAEISVRSEDRRDFNKLYNPMTVAELKKQYPKIDFDLWLNVTAGFGFKLDDSDVISLVSPKYLEHLPDVLEKYSQRTIANYQLWWIVSHLNSYLAPSLRENYRQYVQDFRGTLKFKPRWEECITELLTQVDIPVGALYVKKYFDSESKKDVDVMMSKIRQVMKKTLDEAEWMDQTTKSAGYQKLSEMIYSMAYPADQIYNETWLMLSYNGAKVEKDRYMDNILEIWEAERKRSYDEFRKPVNRTEWAQGFATVNAWYSANKNRMTFPAGILRYPLYVPGAPHYINYGRIGAVIGHELTHGFDDRGRQFDAYGNLNLWWSNSTLDEFKKGAKCIIDQYSQVKDARTGLNLNGVNTQGENIADNGGVKLAYKAYQVLKSDIGTPEEQLTGLKNFTTDQMFFVSYGQVWCSIVREEALHQQIIIDAHSPTVYRVNVVLQNNHDFAKAFNCPVSSPMNPEKKCKVW